MNSKAKLPSNAPEWAKIKSSRGECPKTKGSAETLKTGQGVDIFVDGDFTVVALMKSRDPEGRVYLPGEWKESKLFATKDGINNHTNEYRGVRFRALRAKRLACLENDGLTNEEAVRFFEMGKHGDPQFEQLLIGGRNKLRIKLGCLEVLAATESRNKQENVIRQAKFNPLLGLPSPFVQEFAKTALWVFHSMKLGTGSNPKLVSTPLPLAQKHQEKVSPKPQKEAEVRVPARDHEPLQVSFLSLEAAFATM